MPIEDHPNFRTLDDHATIWRYMDFAKFVSILDTQALYFTRADKLGDPIEGTVSAQTLSFMRQDRERLSHPERTDQWIEEYMQLISAAKTNSVVSCWCVSDCESDAMWQLYSTYKQGIAIKSTIQRLKQSLDQFPRNIVIGEVIYSDYDDMIFETNNRFAPLTYKRMRFQYEQELRAVIPGYPRRGGGSDLERSEFPEGGLSVPIDVAALIEQVVVSPGSAAWFEELVKSVSRRYGFGFDVIPSRPTW